MRRYNEDISRNERFVKYIALSDERDKFHQVKRDFTEKTEEKLIGFANSVNADDFNFDILDFLGRWVLNCVPFLKNIMNTQKLMCDSYNYFGKTIKQIFTQARNADNKYANKLVSNSKSTAENSTKLLRELNSAFTYYRDNKENGCSVNFALENIYQKDDVVIDIKESFIKDDSEIKIRKFIEDKTNINIFDKHSSEI